MSRERIRVLVCDDSAFSRRTLLRMLERSPLVEVVGVAGDGEEALRRTLELEPDLVTLDLEMPRMDGFTFLRLLMARRPTPVIVVSGRSGSQDVFRALDFGAVDFVAKPSPRAHAELEAIEQELLRKVHAVRQLRLDRLRGRLPAPRRGVFTPAHAGTPPGVVTIGASTGGPGALVEVLGSFLEAPPVAVLIAQHMPEGFTSGFAERLGRLTPFAAHEARDGDPLEPGCVMVAPGGRHLEIDRERGRPCARVTACGSGDRFVPSVDRLFVSAAKHLGPELLAVVLTGMGDDGREGVCAVKHAGGRVVAESEQSAVVFGMPKQAIRTGCVDAVLSLHEVAGAMRAGVAPAPRPR